MLKYDLKLQSLHCGVSGVRRKRPAALDTGSLPFGGTTVNAKLWKPGQPCPVVACRQKAKFIRHLSQFRYHWLEKHEKMAAIYKCPQCTRESKRKSDLYRHLRMNHGFEGEDAYSSVISCGIFPNQHYVDPSPLSQEIVFSNCDTP